MTRLFLAAGVAALAIAAPAAAGPHGGGGPKGGGESHGGGGPRGGGDHGGGNPHGGGGGQARAPQVQRMQAPQRVEHQQFRPQQMRAERQQFRPQQMRPQRQEVRQFRAERHEQPHRIQHQQMRAERIQQVQARAADRRQVQAERIQQTQNRNFERQQLRVEQRPQRADDLVRMGNNGRGYGVGGCPPGLADKGCMPPGLARQDQIQALSRVNPQAFQNSRLAMLNPSTRILAPTEAMRYLGAPLSTVNNYVPLAALPQSVSYLYPDTDAYYYRYGDGYLYQVDRSSSLISSLLPLLGGGYLPGSYLPQSYMSSYVPNAYGLNSFYPSSYSNYGGYGDYYGNTCNRYANGVVYQVDCGSGLVQNIVPTYAGGYGVGQMLPSSYGYYNVPTQYRNMYYATNDASYWYAPGAIYQTDPSTNLITSVAALLSPGFTVGQQLPAGYDMYNVPMAYRSTYYDTPNAWYRYNNGSIYQVDPTTQLVTAVVASLLT